jgi:hypothetical protein
LRHRASMTMLMSADELDRVMLRSRIHAVHVAVDRNGRNGNGPLRRERRFDVGACRVSRREPTAMTVRVDDDFDKVGIVEGPAVRSNVAWSNAQVGDHSRHRRRAMARRSLVKPRRPRSLWK